MPEPPNQCAVLDSVTLGLYNESPATAAAV